MENAAGVADAKSRTAPGVNVSAASAIPPRPMREAPSSAAQPARRHPSDEQTRRLELAECIWQLVWHRTGGAVHGLQVIVQPRGILLRGNCATFYSKQLAQHAAMMAAGNLPLTNEIRVW
jgi:hypothetical protein